MKMNKMIFYKNNILINEYDFKLIISESFSLKSSSLVYNSYDC